MLFGVLLFYELLLVSVACLVCTHDFSKLVIFEWWSCGKQLEAFEDCIVGCEE